MNTRTKKFIWNILGTIFFAFLLVSFSWNYYARQKETETLNDIFDSVLEGKRTIPGIIKAVPKVTKQVFESVR